MFCMNNTSRRYNFRKGWIKLYSIVLYCIVYYCIVGLLLLLLLLQTLLFLLHDSQFCSFKFTLWLWRNLIGAIPMVTIHELAQHAHSHGSHAFTHTLLHQHTYNHVVRMLLLRYCFSVHAGSFRVSVIHRTLTWNTGSLLCVRDHS